MITAFIGFALAMRLQVINNVREHISTTPIVLYAGDSDSIWYLKRQSRFVVGNLKETWSTSNNG
jgi:hypothetical protein